MIYKKLFEPLRIRSMTLDNRMVVSAMVTNYCNEDGTATEKYIAYHERKARGGWGLIITEDYAITRDAGAFKRLPGLWADGQIENHRALTDRVHAAGGKIAAQIYHAGRESSSAITGGQLVAPSALNEPSIPELPRELTIPQIETLVQQFADCAERVKKANFDAVEIHGAHGYLIGAFASPFSNKRTDAYGGGIHGRAKFPLDIVKAVRERVGKDFPILYRMSVQEGVEGGLSLGEAQTLACMLEAAGVDCIHCSQGTYVSTGMIIPPAMAPKGLFVKNAAAIRSVVEIPVITVGRITDPEMAEAVLRSGQADLVTMARASLADPALPNKAKNGQEADIIRCIGCRQGCSARNSVGEKVLCTVDPITGMEDEYTFPPVAEKKKVVVIGGGVSGCTAAIAAAMRGHEVTIVEASDRLGGQWALASVPIGKSEFGSFIRWQSKKLADLGVRVLLHTEATPEWIGGMDADVILCATGSIPFIPPIKGIDGTRVTWAADVLAGKVLTGQRVAVIGGGMVGLETAHHLAVYGKEIAIVEMLPEIGRDAEPGTRTVLLAELKEHGACFYANTKVNDIDNDTLHAQQNGQPLTLSGIDTFVMATGMIKNDALVKAICGHTVIPVGDAERAKNGFENIREAFRTGYYLE